MKFSKYIEGRDQQLQQVQRVLNVLMYQHGLDPKTVAATPSEELVNMLGAEIPADWDAHRFVAAVRSYAREGAI